MRRLARGRPLAVAEREAESTVADAAGVPLEPVDLCRCLGRMVSSADNDWPALQKNLTKARQRWGMIRRLLTKDRVGPRHAGMFCKATVQSVLLCGSETWVVSDKMPKSLNGFHSRVARQMSGGMPSKLGSEWFCPPIEDCLEVAGLCPLEFCLERRRNSLADFISTRPVLHACLETERVSGSPADARHLWNECGCTSDADSQFVALCQ